MTLHAYIQFLHIVYCNVWNKSGHEYDLVAAAAHGGGETSC